MTETKMSGRSTLVQTSSRLARAFGKLSLPLGALGVLALVVAPSACSTTDDPDLGANADAGTTSDGAARPDSGGPAPDASTPANVCGNKKLDPGEACDDGNTVSNDGCSATCTIESAGPNDVCGGTAIALAQLAGSTRYTASVAGTTANLYNHYASSCGGGSGADAVYRLDAPEIGRATVRLTSKFAAILSARTACDDTKKEIGCKDGAGSAPDAASELSFPVYPNAPVFLFVDGYGGAKGEFELSVDVQTAFCGNGKAEHPEACDDGNTTDGDGCSATCAIEDGAAVSVCPGMGYRLSATAAKPGVASFAGDTTNLTNSGGSAVGCTPTGAGNNAIYAITPTVSGALKLDLLANYEGALLHVRKDCSVDDTQYDCAGATTALTPLSTTVPVNAEETVYVFVDGNTSSKGLYTLEAKLTTPVCGNGVVDSTEECDDGNTTAGDGCSATCTVERQPESYTCPGKGLRLEAAAPGVRTLKVRGTTRPLPGESLPASKWTACGSTSSDVVYEVTSDIDGYLEATVAGQFNATIAARTTCAATTDIGCAAVSNGNAPKTINAPITKDTPLYITIDGRSPGMTGSFVLDFKVTPSVCGNGVVEGGETCDDGSLDDGDGCSVTCQLEADVARDVCATAPAVALEAAPDGTYGTKIVSGNTNLPTPTPQSHTFTGCSSWWADAWFPITPQVSGVLTATIASATFRSTIGVRTGCAPSGSQLTCDGTNAKGGQEITFAANAGTTYYLAVAGGVVTSGKPEIGRFTVDVKLVPTGCGDTYLNAPEACDDGNTTNGDGCSATCEVENLAGIGACPGHAIALNGTPGAVRRRVVTVDTRALQSKTGSTCGGSGPEGILALTSDIDGQLQVTGTGYAMLVHARTTCNDPLSEIPRASCSSALGSFSTTVMKNQPYYLYVDGVNGASGIAKLQITVTP